MSSNNNQRIAKNTLFLYIRMAFSLVVTLYTSRVILNVLGVEDYGVYNVVAGFVSMFTFLNGALNSSIQRYYNYENGRIGEEGFQNVYITSVFIQLILTVLSVVLVETVGLWFFENRLVIPEDRIDSARLLFHVSVLTMSIVVMQVPYSSAILAKEKMDYFALVGVLDVLFKLLVVFLIDIIPGDKLVTYSWLLALVTVIDFLLYYVYSKIKFKEIKFHLKFDKGLFKAMLVFSGWSAFSGFSQMIRNQGINMVLNVFFGPVVNAARGISYQIKSALISFVGNITVASRPQMVESYAAGNSDRSIRLMNSTSKLCFVLLFMMALPISVEIEYVLNLWLKNTVPDYTAIFSILVLAVTLVDILQTPITMMVYATGKIAKYNIVSSVVGLLILPLAYIVLKLGAKPEIVYVLSFFISILIQVFSVLIFSKLTGYQTKKYITQVILPLLIVVIVTTGLPFIPHLLMPESFFRLLVVCGVSLIGVGACGYYFAFDKSEKEIVKQLANKFLSRLKIIKVKTK